MSLDPLLPTAPARVRALLLPAGQITSDRFTSFVARLREEHVVHLRDVTPDPRPNRSECAPLSLSHKLTRLLTPSLIHHTTKDTRSLTCVP